MIFSLPKPGPRPVAAAASSAAAVAEAPSATPLDAFVPRPGGDGANACRAWDPPPAPAPLPGTKVTPPGPPVVVVMDGAIDVQHPALAGSLWTNPGEIAGDGIDNDGNGVVDDVHGFNVGLGNGDLTAGKSLDHGTHVAGIVVAQPDGRGHGGVAAGQAVVMGVGGMYDGCDLLTNFERAVDYVVDMKNRGANVRVVNASFGGAYPDRRPGAVEGGGGEAGRRRTSSSASPPTTGAATTSTAAGHAGQPGPAERDHRRRHGPGQRQAGALLLLWRPGIRIAAVGEDVV